MSSNIEQESAKVCCSSGAPSSNSAAGEGTVVESAGMKMYRTGSGSARGILAVYDIFGFDIGQTRQFVDDLARATDATVVMPDFYHGKAWSLAEFPPKDKDKFNGWLGSTASVDKALDAVRSSCVPFLRSLVGPSAPLSVIGFCWGGKVVVKTLGQADNVFKAGVGLHPAFLSDSDMIQVGAPLALLPAENDPDMEPFMKLLQKKPFGAACLHRRFLGVEHGFCAARGDRSDPKQMAQIQEALETAATFITKNA